MIRTIYIKDENSDRYTLRASTHVLGKTFDNKAEQIKVMFPAVEIEKSSACTMFVFADGEQIDSISVSHNVPFDITNVLSRHKEIEIGFRFTNSDDYVKNCDFDKFYFTEVKQPVPYTPATPEQESQINTLLGQAFVNVRWKTGTSDQIEFLNLSGGVQHTLTIADATTSASGFMSASDKTKLNGIEAGAEVNDVTSVNGKTGAVVLDADDVDALPDTTKYGASIDLTIDSTTYVVTAQLKDQDGNNIGSAKTIDLPIESVVVSGSYDSVNKKIILTLQSGSTIEFSVADLVSGLVSDTTTIAGIRLNQNISASDLRTALNVENGASAFNENNIIAGSNISVTKSGKNVTIGATGLQPTIDSSHKLDADLVDDTTSTNKFVTASDKSNWNGKQSAIDSSHKLSADVVDDTSTTNKFVTSSDKEAWNGKQDPTDNSLTTTSDSIVGAINEVNSIAKGANKALSYGNYATMITAFNALASDVYNVGQNVMIVTLEVPDLWISSIEETSVAYTYTSDSAFTTALATNGYVQVGYYKLSALENQKVDLTDYVPKTTTIAGVDLQDNITKSELQTALDVDDKLDKNSTTGAPNYHGMVYGINTSGNQEMIPLARANMTVNAIPRYDASSDLFVATNQSGNNYCAANVRYVNGRTTSLTGTSAPTTSTEASFVGQIYLDTTNNNTYQCTAITTENDTTTYTWVQLIRATDYATQNNAGVVKVNAGYGIRIFGNGAIATQAANNNGIAAKNNDYYVITPSTLDFAVKVGVTTNVNTLTDTEKTNACAWLGTGKVVTISQADYDALVSGGTVDTNTYYFIEEE